MEPQASGIRHRGRASLIRAMRMVGALLVSSFVLAGIAGPASAESLTGSVHRSPRGVGEPSEFDPVLFAALVLGVGLVIVVLRISRERRAHWSELRSFRAELDQMDLSELVS